MSSTIYDNVQHITNEVLRVLPKAIPWTTIFEDKTYDGKNYLTGKSVSYTDVKGQSVPAVLSAVLVKKNGSNLAADTASPITAPTAAGPYAIGAEITDENYSKRSKQLHLQIQGISLYFLAGRRERSP